MPPLRLSLTCSQLYEQHSAVGLDLCLVRGAVPFYLPTFRASMVYYKALFRVDLGKDRLHKSAAGVFSVARIYVNVERPQTKGTVIARGIAKRLDLLAAMSANKGGIVFSK